MGGGGGPPSRKRKTHTRRSPLHLTHISPAQDLIPPYKILKMASSLPNFLRPLVATLMNDRRSRLVSAGRSGGISAYDYWQRMADLNAMRSAWEEKATALGVDGFLHVALPLPALKCGTSGDLTGAFSYTLLAKESEGLPMSVAVMTPLWRDEECLRIMKEIERVAGFSKKPQDYLD